MLGSGRGTRLVAGARPVSINTDTVGVSRAPSNGRFAIFCMLIEQNGAFCSAIITAVKRFVLARWGLSAINHL